MFFIYGTRSKIKTIQSLGTGVCENCHHRVEKTLAKEKKSITFFYIPVFSRTSSKFILCPCCGESKKLTGDEFRALKKSQVEGMIRPRSIARLFLLYDIVAFGS